MYKVTIAIPVYNVEKYIEKSLLSALNQTYKNIEYVLVDDRGSDNSMEIVNNVICNHYRGKDVKIVTHPHNIGTGGARNSCINNATGDYVFFMDSDDTIEPETIQTLCDCIGLDGTDIVEGSYRMLTNEGKVISECINPDYYVEGRMAICNWMKNTKLYYDGFPWNRLISLKMLKDNQIECIPSHKNEDVYFSFQIVLHCHSIKTIPNITYNYYMRPGSTIHRKIDKFFYNQFVEIFDARTRLMRELRIDKPTVLYNYYLQHFFEWWIDSILKGDFTKGEKLLFYKKMQTVFTLDFNQQDLVGIRYKIKFYLLRYNSYFPYLIFSFFDSKCHMLYTIFQNRLSCFSLPYNHL